MGAHEEFLFLDLSQELELQKLCEHGQSKLRKFSDSRVMDS